MNLLLFSLLLATADTHAHSSDTPVSMLDRLTIDGEIGPSYIFQNDNRYGATGTRYSAADVGERRNLFIGKRLSVEARLTERNTLILLYAPLDLTTRKTLDRDIDFKGTQFFNGEVVDHRYLFDGYRASYLYGLIRSKQWQWDLGGSFQIRNASVELGTVDGAPARYAVESDIGLVFALKTRLTFAPSERLWATLEADGFSTFGAFKAFSGAIYDLSLSLGTPLTPGLDAFLRLRLLGGGAVVPRRNIDTWANLFFATAGARVDVGELFSRR